MLQEDVPTKSYVLVVLATKRHQEKGSTSSSSKTLWVPWIDWLGLQSDFSTFSYLVLSLNSIPPLLSPNQVLFFGHTQKTTAHKHQKQTNTNTTTVGPTSSSSSSSSPITILITTNHHHDDSSRH